MINIDKKIKTSLIAIIILNILAVSSYYLFIGKIIEKKNASSLAVEELKGVLIEESKINATKNILKVNKGNLDRIESSFINSDSLVVFLEEIEALGKEAGVELKLSSVAIEKKDGDILNLNINTIGHFRDIYSFMLVVEQLPYKISFNRSHLRKIEGEDENSGLWNGSFSLGLLSFKKTN